MSIKSSGLLVSDLITVLPDNSTAEISEADVRNTFIDVIDSVPLLSSGNGAGVPHWLVQGRLSASNFDTPNLRNTLGGRSALDDFTLGTAEDNTAFGFQSLTQLTTGLRNTAVGVDAMKSHMDNVDNTALGYNALKTNTTGSGNVALGALSLECNTDGSGNVAIGYAAGASYEGNDGLFIANRSSETLIRGDFNLQRVGIAESNPIYTLDVSGVGRFQGNLYATAKLGVNTVVPVFTTDIVGDIKYTGSGDFNRVYTTGESIFNYRQLDRDFTIYGSGQKVFMSDASNCRVGFFTNTPSGKIHINGDIYLEPQPSSLADTTHILYNVNNVLTWGGGANFNRVDLETNFGVSGDLNIEDAPLISITTNRLYANAGNLYWDGVVIGSGVDGGGLGVWSRNANQDIHYSLGDVGIKTTDPTSDLHVVGTIDTDDIAIGLIAGISGQLNLANIVTPTTSGNRLYAVNGDLYWAGVIIGSGIGGGGGGGSIWSQVGSDAVYTLGNVGIGISPPNSMSKLHVLGRAEVDSIIVSGDAGISGVVEFASVTSPSVTTNKLYSIAGDLYWDGIVIGSGVSATPGWWTRTGNDIYYNDGNVGFNNIFPSNLIHASGGATVLDMWVERNAGVSGNIRIENISTPTDVTNKLYAQDSNLYWNGSVIGNPAGNILQVQVFS